MRHKPTTEKQITANRRNAQKSTGPQTSRGKINSKRNSLKHGLLSREVVIRKGDGKENVDDYRDMLSRMIAYYKPQGPIERMLVDTITSTYWRLARIVRKETGEIRKKLDTFSFDQELEVSDADRSNVAALKSVNLKPKHPADSCQIEKLVVLLQSMKKEISEFGRLGDDILSKGENAYKQLNNQTVDHCIIFNKMILGDEQVKQQYWPDEEITPERCRQNIFQILGSEIEILQELQPKFARKEALALETGMAINALPDEKELLLLMRYETSLRNNLFKAMHELQRVQAFRLGQKALVPIAVDVISEDPDGSGRNN